MSRGSRKAKGGKTAGAPKRKNGVVRLVTAAVAVPLALAAIFMLPDTGFFVVCAVLLGLASLEFVAIGRHWAAGAPLWLLTALAVVFAYFLSQPESPESVSGAVVMVGALVLSVGLGLVLLLARTPLQEAPAALGLLGFGTLYFALPIASLVHLQRADPWLVGLLVAIVWLGDTAAYYVGTQWGKHKMAPVISPKKSWEGAAASLVMGMLAALVWSVARLGEVEAGVLWLGLLTSCAAQLGDLVESMFKRGAGVKDSGRFLPGHGGFLDRADALLFAAPVLWVGLLLLGIERALP